MSVWTKDVVSCLIEEYKKWPHLYQTKSVHHKNRNLINKALLSIQSELKQKVPNISVNDIKGKWQALKQTAARELRKWDASKKSGAATDEVATPSLWYFDEISFIFDDLVPRPAIDTLDDASQDETNSYDGEIYENINIVVEQDENLLAEADISEAIATPDGSLEPTNLRTPSRLSQRSFNESSTNSKGRKRKCGDTGDMFLSAITNNMNVLSSTIAEHNAIQEASRQGPSLTSNSLFGQFIMTKLNLIEDHDIREEAEAAIVSIVYNALKRARESITE